MLHPRRRTVGVRILIVVAQAIVAGLGEPLVSSTLIMPGEDRPLTQGWEIMERLDHVLDAVVDSGECGEIDYGCGSLQRPSGNRSARSGSFAFRVTLGVRGPMGKDFAGTVQQTAETFVAQLMRSKSRRWPALDGADPLFLVRSILARDNARENERTAGSACVTKRDGTLWRSPEIDGALCQDGFVLDIGCSQGSSRRDEVRPVPRRRQLRTVHPCWPGRCDRRTQFVCADGVDFGTDKPPNAVVMNEVIYYLRIPSPQ